MTDSDKHIAIELEEEKTAENVLHMTDKEALCIAQLLLVLADAINEIVEN